MVIKRGFYNFVATGLTKRTLTALLASVALAGGTAAFAQQTPASYGAPSTFEHSQLRVPMVEEAPKIDGVKSEGEWTGAAGFSGVWYDFSQGNPRFLASHHLQPRAFFAYDKENFYILFSNQVYPDNDWLKARGRFPDVLGHSQYGVLWDDHVEFELRPYPNLRRAFRLGMLRFDINPIGTTVDWYWSTDAGQDRKWKSEAKIRTNVTKKRWYVEMAIPFKELRYGNYKQKEDGKPLVQAPPPDGFRYRYWLHEGIGGNGVYSLHYDKHNTQATEAELIFDSKAPSFQIKALGKIMKDMVNVDLTIKNHNTRSETVRLGFFMESAAGNIYSSYNSPKLNNGLIELRPGEVRHINLKQPFPGISRNGNVLWFDVRSAGRPAKILYRTRLTDFHSMQGGRVDMGEGIGIKTYRERRLDPIDDLRPPRRDFDMRWNYSITKKQLAVVVDKGIRSASKKAKRSTEAKLEILTADAEEKVFKQTTVPFNGDFACSVMELPDLKSTKLYKLHVLLFDNNKRIVGERTTRPFCHNVETTVWDEEGNGRKVYKTTEELPEWVDNERGLSDIVWEPFTAIEPTENGFNTLKHNFTIADTGMPAQVRIKPNVRDVPLEKRDNLDELSDDTLQYYGRGPQLRQPFRFVATVNGKRIPAKVVNKAQVVKDWKSERKYKSKLKAGPVTINLTTRYDCDGAAHYEMTYDTGGAQIDKLELVGKYAGRVDTVSSAAPGSGMAGPDVFECSLPAEKGVVWNSTSTNMEMFYTKFIPFFWVGSGERGFTWICDSDKGWELNRDGSSMLVERDNADYKGATWRVMFVNHPSKINKPRNIEFTILTHPSKPKPDNYRQYAWHYCGIWAKNYMASLLTSMEDLKEQARSRSELEAPWIRWGYWRGMGTGNYEFNKKFEDQAAYYHERTVRVARRIGGWHDEFWPAYGKNNNLANDTAYLRDPENVRENELPYHPGWNTHHMRNTYKRFARNYAKHDLINRSCGWANNEATNLASFFWDTMMVEDCGAGPPNREIDLLTKYPHSLYRYIAHSWTGLISRFMPGFTPSEPGGNPLHSREWLGVALTHDVGVNFAGPHGNLRHIGTGFNMLNRLSQFGLFTDDEHTQYIPPWRNDAVQFGKGDPVSDVYVTVYRRPKKDGDGYKALIVVLNRAFKDVQAPLVLKNAEGVLGGANTLTASAATEKMTMTGELKQWWDRINPDGKQPVLRNAETGGILRPIAGSGSAYGPVFIPEHDFRVFYAEFGTE